MDPQKISVQVYEYGESANWTAAFERNVRKTIQHEVGHSVGMKHHSGAVTLGGTLTNPLAMISGHVTSDLQILYTQHHKDHVNNAY